MKDQKMLNEEIRNLSGPKIKWVRSKKKITQRELVERLTEQGVNITPCTLSKMETQQRGITDIELVALSRALEVSVDVLIDTDE